MKKNTDQAIADMKQEQKDREKWNTWDVWRFEEKYFCACNGEVQKGWIYCADCGCKLNWNMVVTNSDGMWPCPLCDGEDIETTMTNYTTHCCCKKCGAHGPAAGLAMHERARYYWNVAAGMEDIFKDRWWDGDGIKRRA